MPVGADCISSIIRSTTASQVISDVNTKFGTLEMKYAGRDIAGDAVDGCTYLGAAIKTLLHQSEEGITRNPCLRHRRALSHSILPLRTVAEISYISQPTAQQLIA